MAYLKELTVSHCKKCGKRATIELFNRVNASQGRYCKPCGRAALRQMSEREQR